MTPECGWELSVRMSPELPTRRALSAALERINSLSREREEEGCRVGVICTEETRERYHYGEIRSVGQRAKEETIAHNLFAVLREFDDLKAEVIFSESFGEDHLGQAIMNRLSKAAGYKIVRV